MALTDTQIRAAHPRAKPYKLPDSDGLYVHIMPTGARIFRVRWQKDGRETVETLGRYGDVTLGEARRRTKEIKAGLRQGITPDEARKAREAQREREAQSTFRSIANEWLKGRASHWSPGHLEAVKASLERAVMPLFGDMPVAQITAPAVLKLLRGIEQNSPDLAHRMQRRIGVDPVLWTPLKSFYGVSDAAFSKRLSAGVPATDGGVGSIRTNA